MKKFGLYVVQGQTLLLRYIDGVYTLVRPCSQVGVTGPSKAWEYLSTAKGYTCNQAWAERVNKESLLIPRNMATVIYGIPESVDFDAETRFERRR